jgi:hypothetical protein
VKLPPPEKGKVSERTRTQAERDYTKGQKSSEQAPSARRSRATRTALNAKVSRPRPGEGTFSQGRKRHQENN